MIACSGYVDEEVVIQTKKVGFAQAFTAPLGANLIIEKILPLIEIRENKINHKKSISQLLNSNIQYNKFIKKRKNQSFKKHA